MKAEGSTHTRNRPAPRYLFAFVWPETEQNTQIILQFKISSIVVFFKFCHHCTCKRLNMVHDCTDTGNIHTAVTAQKICRHN